MKRTFIAAMAAASVVASHIPDAVAGVITVTNIAIPYEETLTIGNPLSPAEGAYVGQQVLTTSTGQTIDAWCIDLVHDAYLGNQSPNFDYQIEPIATNNDPNYAGGAALSASQIAEISGLVIYGDNLLAAGGSAATLDQDSAAVQLAIWAVEYSTANSPFTYGGYPSGNAPQSLIDQTDTLVSDAEAGDFSGHAVEMAGLDNQQSYAIDPVVPEPGALTLFATALSSLWVLRYSFHRRLSRRPAACRAGSGQPRGHS
jgi:hypothetical protein